MLERFVSERQQQPVTPDETTAEARRIIRDWIDAGSPRPDGFFESFVLANVILQSGLLDEARRYYGRSQ